MSRRQKQAHNTKVVAIVGAVLILGVFLFMGKDWIFKKYYNKAGGFSVKYPLGWTLQENKGGASVIFFSPKEGERDIFQENVNVVVQDISANPLDLEAYTKLAIRQMQLVFENNFIVIESVPTTIAARAGHRLVFIGKGPGMELKYMSVWFLDGMTAYQITYTAMSSRYEKYDGKMNRMVNSFRIE